MSAYSPVSPRTSLRRRGRQENGQNEASTSKSPVSPRSSHTRLPSDGFGDFVDSTLSQPQDHQLPSLSIGGVDEDWQDADIVQAFSPVESKQKHDVSAKAPQDLDSFDWDAWATPTGPSPRPDASAGASSNADDAFFAAFEKASVAQEQQAPSPPVIDLREMERKLDTKRKEEQGLLPNDLDFFENFEQSPRVVMSRSRERAGVSESLRGSQLENMTEAQASPMDIMTPIDRNQRRQDYFGEDTKTKSGSPSGQKSPSDKVRVASPSRSESWSEAAGYWAGTFRKTLGSLRGQAADFAQHLPSAKDFIVPEDEGNKAENAGEIRYDSRRHTDEGPSAAKSPPRKIARESEHSQSTPFGMISGVGPTSPPSHATRSGSMSAAPTIHAPIKGAPGFNPNSVHNWNTGHWSLSSTEESQRGKKPIPVDLKGRREETQEVIGDDLAAHLTAHLPKRLQLGKSWKLLYSSDQHGISLGTMYWKVESGLDGSKGGRTSAGGAGGGGVVEAEGWLRGASLVTKEAVTGVRRVGGGLSMNDAGIILAIRDSNDRVFGAYVNERLRAQSNYYGNGECFLWKATEGGKVKTFRWTGRNDYMVLTEAHYLSFGGGDGKYGLWLDGQLENGVSSKCPAFDNDVLCSNDGDDSEEGKFECIILEVWACGID